MIVRVCRRGGGATRHGPTQPAPSARLSDTRAATPPLRKAPQAIIGVNGLDGPGDFVLLAPGWSAAARASQWHRARATWAGPGVPLGAAAGYVIRGHSVTRQRACGT
jgi:hypothetical protein